MQMRADWPDACLGGVHWGDLRNFVRPREAVGAVNKEGFL